MRYLTRICREALILFGMLLICFAARGSELTLTIGDIASPAFRASGIRLALPTDGSAELNIAKLNVDQREFRRVRVRCARFTLSPSQLACRQGRLDAIPDARLEFSYGFATRQLQASLLAPGGESWQVSGQLAESAWQLAVQLRQAQVRRLSFLLPTKMPQISQGALTGVLRLSGDASGMQGAGVDLQLVQTGFSNADGLHAAEKLGGKVSFTAKRTGFVWNWQGNVVWQSGELFWQPLYLTGGHALSGSGSFDGRVINIKQALVQLPGAGQVQLTGLWNVPPASLQEGSLRGSGLDLAALFSTYAQPYLEKGSLSDAALYGHADVAAYYRRGELQSLRLNLHEAGISDASHRYALLGVNSDIDWRLDAASVAVIDFAGGALLGAPIGAGQWRVKMDGLKFEVPQASLQILDGSLNLQDFHLQRAPLPPPCDGCTPAWHWAFSASLLPVSMDKISQTAGWPVMLGTLAARIPKVSYDGHAIKVEGALLFNVFDGTVVATGLELNDAFGRAPRLSGNLAMRNLDLDLLTRTFSFGNMQGRLDADVKKLQLQDWQPLSFEARLYSSAGRYPKKISQKAVQNISSLGGSGAAAAIQRSFLGFFENFGYDSIGWSCIMRNGICQMGGIEGTDGHGSGMYEIVRGGGIPAITVMGYNRSVSWVELTQRLKRVTQGNAKPVVQ
ncbi:MAG: hypothetical protein PHP85_13910 [Gallionella sp.]|nr:hypothetical protein [Gallionella sp.]